MAKLHFSLMSGKIKEHLPSDTTTTNFGLQNTPRLEKIYEDLSNIETDDITGILREVRRAIYTKGLRGGYKGIQESSINCAIREQAEIDRLSDPVRDERSEQYTERLRKWRSYFALRALSVLGSDEQAEIIGAINARLRKNDNYEKGFLYFNEEGNLKIPITSKTPLDVMMDIMALAEKYEGQTDIPNNVNPSSLRNARLGVLEHLTKLLITDDPKLHGIGMKYLKLRHFREILRSVPGSLGEGRIGGKAAGMLLAYAIMETEISEFDNAFCSAHCIPRERLREHFDIGNDLHPNKSYFLGSNILDEILRQGEMRSTGATTFKYSFHETGGEEDTEKIERESARIRNTLFKTKLPEYLRRQLRDLYKKLHGKPCIVRSSSELEDRFGAAFAGKYESVYLANSHDFESDFEKFINAIKEVFASVFTPDVMRYRAKRGLIPFTEEMGLLIQELNGEQYGDFFCPIISGVAMSKATESWGPDPERGAMKVAIGLGETVVEKKPSKVVMLAKPESDPNLGRKSVAGQSEIAVIDKGIGERKFVQIRELLDQVPFEQLPAFSRLLATVDARGDRRKFSPLTVDTEQVIITFDGMLAPSEGTNNFPLMIEYIIQKLKYVFGSDVDVEFTASYNKTTKKYSTNIVQCRPQNIHEDLKDYKCPPTVSKDRILLETQNSLGCGRKQDIKYIVYIPPDFYKGDAEVEGKLTTPEVQEIRKWIQELDTKLGKGNYIIVAPGRLGSNDPDQGIPVNFSDFLNAAGFVELTGHKYGASQPSFGTHFYQEVVEAGMAKFAVSLEESDLVDNICNRIFLDTATNSTVDFVPNIPPRIGKWLRVIDVSKEWSKHIGEEGKGKNWCLQIAQTNRAGKDGKRKGTAYISEQGKESPKLLEA